MFSGNLIPISSWEDMFKMQFSLKRTGQLSQYLILYSPYPFIPDKISYYCLTIIVILVWGYALWGFTAFSDGKQSAEICRLFELLLKDGQKLFRKHKLLCSLISELLFESYYYKT